MRGSNVAASRSAAFHSLAQINDHLFSMFLGKKNRYEALSGLHEREEGGRPSLALTQPEGEPQPGDTSSPASAKFVEPEALGRRTPSPNTRLCHQVPATSSTRRKKPPISLFPT